jgi:hypothetical protein
LYNQLRIDADPTTWELSKAVEDVPTSTVPVVLPVDHPLKGNLVLSGRSMGSAVYLEFFIEGTHANGMLLGGSVLYVPSPLGPDVYSIPKNVYTLPDAVDRAELQADIIAAMTDGTFLTVNVKGGVVVINGAEVPFVVLCPPHTKV